VKVLHDHQVEWNAAIARLVQEEHCPRCYPERPEVKGCRRVLAQAPTGMGKTVCVAALAQQVKPEMTVMVCVHRQELLYQAAAHLAEHRRFFPSGDPIFPTAVASPSLQDECGRYVRRRGYLQGEEWWVGNQQRTLVAMVPTLHRWMQSGKRVPPPPKVLIIDEAHHACAQSWVSVIDHYERAGSIVIGMTATPERADGVGLVRTDDNPKGVFHRLHIGPSIRELADNGFLSPPVVMTAREGVQQMDTSGIRIEEETREYALESAAAERQAVAVAGNALANYRRHMDGLPALAFCLSVRHAKREAARWREAGYAATAIHGGQRAEERARAIEDLGRGKLHLLASCNVIGEGVDVPAVAGAIFLRPTMSRTIYLQQVGRALRVWPGKSRAVILDHAGNSIRHGHPMDDIRWKTDGTEEWKRRKSGDGTMPCPECGQANDSPFQQWQRCKRCGIVLRTEPVGRVSTEDATPLVSSVPMTPQQKAWGELWQGLQSHDRASILDVALRHGLDETWADAAARRIESFQQWQATPLGSRADA